MQQIRTRQPRVIGPDPGPPTSRSARGPAALVGLLLLVGHPAPVQAEPPDPTAPTSADRTMAPPPDGPPATPPAAPTTGPLPIPAPRPDAAPGLAPTPTLPIETPDPPPDPDHRLVVTASRSANRRFEAPRSITAVDADQILGLQPRTLPEALAESPGVFLQQTNRGAGSPVLRGQVGPQNLILVDGIRFSTSTFRIGPLQYLALLDPGAAARVEVVRGPASVLYGSGAMGGVIQLLTPPPWPVGANPGLHGHAAVHYSSADEGVALRLGGQGRVGWVAGELAGSLGQHGPLTAGEGAVQPLSDYSNRSWRTKLVVAPPASPWSLTGSYLNGALRDVGRTDELGRGDVRFYDNDDHLAALTLRYQGREVLHRGQVTLSYHRLTEEVRRYTCSRNARGVPQDFAACQALDLAAMQRLVQYSDAVDVLGGELSAELRLLEGRLRFTTGGEWSQEWVSSAAEGATSQTDFRFTPLARGNYSDGSGYRTLGAFVLGEATVLELGPRAGEVRVTGGGRFSHFWASAPDVPELGDITYAQHGLVGAAGVQWLLPDRIQLYASYHQGLRAPNLQEATVLGDTGSKFAVPNPDLEPERNGTLEVGSRLHLGPLRASGSWFRTRLAQAIDEELTSYLGQTMVEGKPVVRRINAASGLYRGVEGEVALELTPLTLSGHATWIEGELQGADGTTHPGRLVPPLFGRAGLAYTHPGGRVQAELFVLWAGAQERLSPVDRQDLRICQTAPHSGVLADPCPGSPAWQTLNFRATWQPSPLLRFDLALHNLTDERYRLHGSGFDLAGFETKLGMRAEF